jgi:hypothetical protein
MNQWLQRNYKPRMDQQTESRTIAFALNAIVVRYVGFVERSVIKGPQDCMVMAAEETENRVRRTRLDIVSLTFLQIASCFFIGGSRWLLET